MHATGQMNTYTEVGKLVQSAMMISDGPCIQDYSSGKYSLRSHYRSRHHRHTGLQLRRGRNDGSRVHYRDQRKSRLFRQEGEFFPDRVVPNSHDCVGG